MSSPGIDPLQAMAAQPVPQEQIDPLQAMAAGGIVAPETPAPIPQLVQGPPDNLTFVHDFAAQIPGMYKTEAFLRTIGVDPGGVQTGSFGERYQKNLVNTRGEIGSFEASHPQQAYGAKAAGVVAPMLSMGGGEIPSFWKTVGKGAGLGALFGFGSTDDSSVKGDVLAASAGALGGATLGAAGYGTGTILGKAGGAVANIGSDYAALPKAQKQAADLLLKKFGQQGISLDDATAFVTGTNKPLTLMDMGDNSPTQRLGRYLATTPGPAGEQTGAFLNARQTGQRARVLGDISALSPDTNKYDIATGIRQERSVNSDPLYQQAFANTGVGPVNYEAARSDLITATSQKAAIAKQIRSIEQNNSGALAARGAAGADTRANYMDLQQQLKDAEATRTAAASHFENVQAGVSALESNQPLTDARLSDFMKDPDIRAGMAQGLNIQRRLALANGEEFDPNAYAITGYDDKGMPQVGPVPTWRTLHAGRMGLDNMIYSQADPLTGKLPATQEMQSLQSLRRAYGAHLQALNPDLQAADQAWSGPSEQLGAIDMGGKIFRADPEQIAAYLQGKPAETVAAYRVGSGRAMADVANDTRDTSNIPQRLSGDATTRAQLGAAYGAPSIEFSRQMSLEDAMARTRNFVTGNSSTANKAADLAENEHPLSGIIQDAVTGFAAGGPKGMVVVPAINAGKKLANKVVGSITSNQARNLELARVLTATGAPAKEGFQSILAPTIEARDRSKKIVSKAQRLGAALIGGALPYFGSPSGNNGP